MSAPITDAPVPAPGWLDRPGWWLALCGTAYLPFTLLGFGSDVDVPNVLRSGRAFVEDGRYEMSRGPGAVVHEVATGVLDQVGGSVLVNLASVGFALLGLWSVQALLRAESARWPVLAMLVLASNPWFWIAATSLGDYTWALGLLLAGAVVSTRGRPVPAGILFALAIGCRASSALLVVGWLVAQRTGRTEDQASVGDAARTAGVAVVLGALLFVPPWLAADRSADFLDNQLELASLGVHLGRALAKNAAVVGVLAAVVLLSGILRIARDGLGRWSSSVVVRFSVIMIVVTELLFLRFPFKPLHLLPVVAAVALLVGSTPTLSRRWIATLIVAQLVGGVVGTTIAAPDVIDDASSGRLELGVTAGVVVTDVRCRLDDRNNGEWEDLGSIDAAIRGAQNAACQSGSWRAEPEP